MSRKTVNAKITVDFIQVAVARKLVRVASLNGTKAHPTTKKIARVRVAAFG